MKNNYFLFSRYFRLIALLLLLLHPLFFFNDTATTEIYTLSLHDALPILVLSLMQFFLAMTTTLVLIQKVDRKSTRLNSSHAT